MTYRACRELRRAERVVRRRRAGGNPVAWFVVGACVGVVFGLLLGALV